MYTYKRTNSSAVDFQNLVIELDKYLADKDGEAHDFYAQYNKIDNLKNVILVYDVNGRAVGCGAIKEYEEGSIEIKRMFVAMDQRGKGIAGNILEELQRWAKELGYQKCILETGDQMLDAIGLYQKHNFKRIPNYGQYATIDNSVCFEKDISTL